MELKVVSNKEKLGGFHRLEGTGDDSVQRGVLGRGWDSTSETLPE